MYPRFVVLNEALRNRAGVARAGLLRDRCGDLGQGPVFPGRGLRNLCRRQRRDRPGSGPRTTRVSPPL